MMDAHEIASEIVNELLTDISSNEEEAENKCEVALSELKEDIDEIGEVIPIAISKAKDLDEVASLISKFNKKFNELYQEKYIDDVKKNKKSKYPISYEDSFKIKTKLIDKFDNAVDKIFFDLNKESGLGIALTDEAEQYICRKNITNELLQLFNEYKPWIELYKVPFKERKQEVVKILEESLDGIIRDTKKAYVFLLTDIYKSE